MTKPSETVTWRHVTGTFHALDYRFAVRSTHEGIGRFVEGMYEACAAPCAGVPTWYSIVDGLPGGWPHSLYVNDDRIAQGAHATQILNFLTWHVNQQVIATNTDRVLLHAAAAADGDMGIVLPAPMESGKTTLVAGLIKAGLRYLTDEAAAIDPSTLQVHPYPKPLSVDPGSWSVLADLEPRVDASTAAYLGEQWQVSPGQFRPDAVSGPVAVNLVVFPRYQAGAPTYVEPLRRSQGLLTLLEQTFGFHAAGRQNLQVLSQFVERVRCFRLASGNLDEACAEVIRLVRAS